MGQVLKINGDYDIITGDGGTITLNTGFNVGTVRVTGNLIVDGDTLTVSAENLNVQDNVIILNFGETGPGVSLQYSGIQVDRGSLTPAGILFDEASDSWNFAYGTPESTFSYDNSAIRVQKILTDSDTTLAGSGRDGDLNLIGAGLGVVTVVGTLNYENQVTQDDDIPNKKYVDDAIQENPTFQIRSPGSGTAGDTRVVALDVDSAGYPAGTFVPPIGPYSGLPTQSEVAVLVDDRRIAVFRKNTIEFTGLTIFTEDPVTGDIAGAIPGNPGQPISVTSIVAGQSYKIVNPGNTNFIAIGSPNNFISTVFTASGPGAGTGTVQLITTDYEGQGSVVLQSDNTNANIKLETNGTGKVVVTYALQLENNNITPAPVAGTTLVYAGPVSTGTSGLYTINDSYTDELVSKNRALLLSMIF